MKKKTVPISRYEKLKETLEHVTRNKDKRIKKLQKENEVLIKISLKQNAQLTELSQKTRKLLEKAKIIE